MEENKNKENEIILASTEPSEENELPEKKKSKWGWFTSFGGLLLLFKAGKIWALIKGAFIFLKFGKFLTTGLSMMLMIITYTFLYGWKYAIGIVLLLFIHEMGHLTASRRLGIDTSLPMFIPFIGAIIQMKQAPKDAKTEAIVGIAGPIFGALGAFVCLLLGEIFNSALLLALAYFGFLLTAFNLIPAHPLDGGRIVTAISLKLWIVGIPVMVFFSLYFFNPIGILISILAIKKAWEVWKDRENPYYDTDSSFRFKMGLSYFSLFALSAYYTYSIHEVLNR
ncbi:site-2 protease family protein [Pelosinus baikalensis]|uniref:Site-2 protease family protein n=1 Tax=Pelosinus baikalensis TaxID=2892015 RepID=A0ABS8HRC8_9FIRM|nr:site-2 protease family protein [Pelosinus baikalensis]MCC5465741.1 site-2 protease family protein [Pelosinus baikalensis]